MDAQVFTRGDFATVLSRPASRIAGVSFLLIVYGIVAVLVNGWQGKFSLWIPALAIVAFLGAWSFTGAINREVVEGRKIVSWGSSLSGMAGLLPYLIGCYFVFYEGIWGILSNVNQLTISFIIARILLIYLGFRMVVRIYELSEIGKRVSAGQLAVTD